MRRPDPGVALYWFAAGDILSRDPDAGARPVSLDAAARLHCFHLSELALAAEAGMRSAQDFHADRERELGAAIAAVAAWRRAACVA